MTNSIELEVEQNKANHEKTMLKRTTWQKIQTVFNVLNHASILAVNIYMTWVTYNAGNLAISWHVFLCTTGYQLLMAQAVLTFYPQNIWSKNITRQTQRTIHWILQVFGSSAAIIGMIIEYIGREQKGKSHFSSIHSLLGLSAGILTLFTLIGGVSALFSIELKQYAKPILFKLGHTLLGIIGFGLGMAALFLGYDRHFMEKNSQPDIRLALQFLAVITIIFSLIGALRALLHHVRIAYMKY